MEKGYEYLRDAAGIGLDIAIVAGAVMLVSMAIRSFKGRGRSRQRNAGDWVLPSGARRYPGVIYN